jgi:hypothetical protein
VRCDCGDCADVCARSRQALGEARKIFGEFNQFSISDIRQHSGDIGVRDEQSRNQALCGVGLNNSLIVVHGRANSETADKA